MEQCLDVLDFIDSSLTNVQTAAGSVVNTAVAVVTLPSRVAKEHALRKSQRERDAAERERRLQKLEKQRARARITNAVSAFAGGAAAVGFAIWCVRRAARLVRDRHRRDTIEGTGVGARFNTGDTYEPDKRDCLPGEAADVISVEEVVEVEDSASVCDTESVADTDAPPGLAPPHQRARSARNVPAVRRITKREKFIHRPDTECGFGSTYLSYIVAQARLKYHGRNASSTHEDAARSWMVREMTGHGVRPTHIAANIEAMVTNVFHVTEANRQEWERRDKLRSVGAYARAVPA